MMTPTASTNDQLRERNLSLALAILHREGSLSRTELTRRLGVTRSTMGVVLADLAALGLVVERPPAEDRGVGRPSPIQEIDPRVTAVAVDVAIDVVQVALVGASAQVRRRTSVELAGAAPVTGALVCDLVADRLERMLADEPPDVRLLGVGVGVPGQVRTADGMVREADHLGWYDEPLAARLAAATRLPVRAANAATLAMRAEYTFGAGCSRDDVLYVIGGSSGIGGGVVGKGGELFLGSDGHAGEIGHTLVVPGGRVCHCGAVGCLEAEVTQGELLAVAGLSSSQVDDLPGRLEAMRADPQVRAVVDRQAALFAIALRNAVNLLNPSTVIVAGFLSALVTERGGEELVGAAIRSARTDLEVIPIVSAAPARVLVGAAELMFDELISAPHRALSGR